MEQRRTSLARNRVAGGKTIDTALLPDRFWSKVAAGPSGCWLWTASLTPHGGYGRFSMVGQRGRRAHRIAYKVLVESIPNGVELDHQCRVRRCVNPLHMQPVLRAEHAAKDGNSLKTHCPAGHPYDKVNTIGIGGKRKGRRCATCHRIREHARFHKQKDIL